MSVCLASNQRSKKEICQITQREFEVRTSKFELRLLGSAVASSRGTLSAFDGTHYSDTSFESVPPHGGKPRGCVLNSFQNLESPVQERNASPTHCLRVREKGYVS